jgi:hypothetical protein
MLAYSILSLGFVHILPMPLDPLLVSLKRCFLGRELTFSEAAYKFQDCCDLRMLITSDAIKDLHSLKIMGKMSCVSQNFSPFMLLTALTVFIESLPLFIFYSPQLSIIVLKIYSVKVSRSLVLVCKQ